MLHPSHLKNSLTFTRVKILFCLEPFSSNFSVLSTVFALNFKGKNKKSPIKIPLRETHEKGLDNRIVWPQNAKKVRAVNSRNRVTNSEENIDFDVRKQQNKKKEASESKQCQLSKKSAIF